MTAPTPSSRPRTYGGRSAQARRLERRERWMAAGLQLFGTVGVRNTSLRALSRHSGVAERYFAENFTDVEDLFVAVHQRLHEELTRAVTQALLTAGPSVSERARLGLRAFIAGLTDDPRCIRIKLVESTAAGPRAEAARQAGQREVGAFLIGASYPGKLPDGIVSDVLGLGLAGGIFELIIGWHHGRIPISQDELVEHCALLCIAIHEGLATLRKAPAAPATTAS